MAVETMAEPMKCKMRIGGEWKNSENKIEIRSPYSHEVIGTTYLAGADQVEAIVQSSLAGFEAMRKTPSYKRYEMLQGMAQRIRERKEEIARTMTLESGKPIKDSRAEIDRAIMTFTVAGEEAKRLPGETIP